MKLALLKFIPYVNGRQSGDIEHSMLVFSTVDAVIPSRRWLVFRLYERGAFNLEEVHAALLSSVRTMLMEAFEIHTMRVVDSDTAMLYLEWSCTRPRKRNNRCLTEDIPPPSSSPSSSSSSLIPGPSGESAAKKPKANEEPATNIDSLERTLYKHGAEEKVSVHALKRASDHIIEKHGKVIYPATQFKLIQQLNLPKDTESDFAKTMARLHFLKQLVTPAKMSIRVSLESPSIVVSIDNFNGLTLEEWLDVKRDIVAQKCYRSIRLEFRPISNEFCVYLQHNNNVFRISNDDK